MAARKPPPASEWARNNTTSTDSSLDLLLTINIGNTNVQCGVFEGGSLARTARFPASDTSALNAFLASCPRPEAALIAAVNPKTAGLVSDSVSLSLGLAALVAGRDFRVPLANRVRLPEKVGIDRLLNALAAFDRAKKACIVADIGTAVTVDAVSATGEFLGGAILPGPSTALAALHSGTALLPAVSLPDDVPVLGRDTEGAMASGVFWGIVGAIEKIMEMLKQEMPGAVTFLTGGAAERFAPRIRSLDHTVPSLTLEGLRLAWQKR